MSVGEDTIKCPSCKNNVSVTYTFCPYCGYDLRPLIRFKARKEVNIKRIIQYRFRWILLKPDTVFKEISITPDLVGPFLIVLFSALLVTFRLGIILGSALFNPVIFLFAFGSSMLILLFILMFYSFLIHVFVKLTGGTGSYTATVSIFGYSFIPAAIGILIVDIYLATTPIALNINNISFLVGVFRVGLYIEVFFLLISAFYFTYGLVYTHGMNRFFAFLVSYISYGLLIAILLSFTGVG